MNFHQLFRKAFGVAGFRIAVQVLQLANALIVVSILPASDYGVYVPMIVLATIGGAVGCRGLDNALVAMSRQVSMENSEVRVLAANAISLGFRFLILVLPILLGFFLYRYLGEISYAKTAGGTILLIVTPWIFVTRRVLESVLVQQDKAITVVILQVATELARSIVLVIGVLAQGGLFLVLLAFMVGQSLNAAAALWLVGKLPLGSPLSSYKIELKQRTNPLIPGIVFAAVQSNIVILLALFVAGVDTIASIAVSARFAFFFAFLAPIANYVLLPMFSLPVPLSTYLRTLAKTMILFGIATLTIASLIFLCFDKILLIIGEEYRVIQVVLPAVLATHILNALAAFFWAAQIGRNWVWGWMPYFSIPFTVILQAIMLFFMDISTLQGAILFGLGTAILTIVIRLIMLTYGVTIHEPRTAGSRTT